ncbi:hypothetical protein AB0F81_26435 [Actinoplanes sp. NPDC024001]|uniref:hypothetical protein n=1 Tax=Actinoplanes sp. NPDC024001 TaxID=3154598 RepID=UPI0034002D96
MLITETDMLLRDNASHSGGDEVGQPVAVGCPDCGGGLRRVDTAGVPRYRCHVGHSFTAGDMLAAQAQNAEAGLLTVASTVRDQAGVYRQLAAKPALEAMRSVTSSPHPPSTAPPPRFKDSTRSSPRSRKRRRLGSPLMLLDRYVSVTVSATVVRCGAVARPLGVSSLASDQRR